MINHLDEVITRLEETGRYESLIRTIRTNKSTSQDTPHVFEALFADAFETDGFPLKYEVNVNPDNDSKVDFLYRDGANNIFLFELVSPEMSDPLKHECEYVQTDIEGITEFEVSLSSNNDNQFLRPEAQTIRLQEKLLEKVKKFPEPNKKTYSVIVVNCLSFHFGNFDDEDCRQIMYGKTRYPAFQEYWNRFRVNGILETDYCRRGASSFRRRITAVIFVPNPFPHPLIGAHLVFNHHRSEDHKKSFEAGIRSLPPVNDLRFIGLTA